MADADLYAEVIKDHPKLNKTTMVGRISSVAADPTREEIILGLDIINDSQNTFHAKAIIPCAAVHLAAETVWYAKLWKKKRLIALEGAFRVVEGVINMTAPDIIPLESGFS